MRGVMSVTIKDVARLAGVSVATVSRVLNDSAPVLETTASRVRSVAEQLRFSPNGAARSLSMQRSHAIGVILPDLYGEFFSELLRGMDQAAQRGGYSLLVSSSHHDARGVDAASRAMRGRVDGLLVMAPDVAPGALEKVLPRSVPTVLLNGRAPTGSVSAIAVDNYGGAASMTRHLIGLGHTRIGFIAGGQTTPRRSSASADFGLRSSRRGSNAIRRTPCAATSPRPQGSPARARFSSPRFPRRRSSPPMTRWRLARSRFSATPGSTCRPTSRCRRLR